MSNDIPAKAHDVHDRILIEIESRIASLSPGAPGTSSDGSAWGTDEVDQQLEHLHTDKKELLEHWTTGGARTGADAHDAALSKACGSPQPCPHVLRQAEKYGVRPY